MVWVQGVSQYHCVLFYRWFTLLMSELATGRPYAFLVVKSLSWVWLFCNPMDYSPPGASVDGVSQARILKWVAVAFSRGSSQPRDRTCMSCIGRRILYHWTTSKAHMNVLGTLHVNEKGLEVSEHGTQYSEGQQVVFIDKNIPGAQLPGVQL